MKRAVNVGCLIMLALNVFAVFYFPLSKTSVFNGFVAGCLLTQQLYSLVFNLEPKR